MSGRRYLAVLVTGALFAGPARAGEPEFSVRVEPPRVAIGQPFEVLLDCVHDAGRAPRFDVLELADTWWQDGERRVLTLPLADQPGRATTRVSWRLVGIEPGSHELELPPARLNGAQGSRLFPTPAAALEIVGELAEGEDQPRELAGFRPPPEELPSALDRAAILVVLVALVLLLLLIGALLRYARRRGGAPRERAPGAAQQLFALDLHDPARAREAFALASRAVREAIDADAGQDLSGCTDEEWIERCRASGCAPAARLERAGELLRDAARVKYGMQQPTRWALEELVAATRAVLEDSSSEERAA